MCKLIVFALAVGAVHATLRINVHAAEDVAVRKDSDRAETRSGLLTVPPKAKKDTLSVRSEDETFPELQFHDEVLAKRIANELDNILRLRTVTVFEAANYLFSPVPEKEDRARTRMEPIITSLAAIESLNKMYVDREGNNVVIRDVVNYLLVKRSHDSIEDIIGRLLELTGKLGYSTLDYDGKAQNYADIPQSSPIYSDLIEPFRKIVNGLANAAHIDANAALQKFLTTQPCSEGGMRNRLICGKAAKRKVTMLKPLSTISALSPQLADVSEQIDPLEYFPCFWIDEPETALSSSNTHYKCFDTDGDAYVLRKKEVASHL
jgi:hypothetical protein